MDHDNIMDGPSSGRGFVVSKRRLPSIAELSASLGVNQHQHHHHQQSQQQSSQQQRKQHQHQQQAQMHQQFMQIQRQGGDKSSKCFSATIIGGQYRNRHSVSASNNIITRSNSISNNNSSINSNNLISVNSNGSLGTRKQISPAASMMLDTRRAKQISNYSSKSHSHNHHRVIMNKSASFICSSILAPKFVYNMTLLALLLMAHMLAAIAVAGTDVSAVASSKVSQADVVSPMSYTEAKPMDSLAPGAASLSGDSGAVVAKHANEVSSEAAAKQSPSKVSTVEAKSSSSSSSSETVPSSPDASSTNGRRSKNMAPSSKADKTKAELRSATAASPASAGQSSSSSVAPAKASLSGPYSSFYKASDDNHLKHKLKRFLPLLSMGSSSGKPNSKASHLPRAQASSRADVHSSVGSSSSSYSRPTPFLVKKASVDRQGGPGGGGVSSLLANPLGLGLLFSMPSLLLTPLALAGLAPAMSAINNFFGDDDEPSSSSSSSGPLSSILGNSGSQSSSSGSQSLAASALSSILGPPPQAEKPMFNPGMFLNNQGVSNAIGSLSSSSSSSSGGGSSSSSAGGSSFNPFKNLFGGGGGGNSLMQASASALSPSYAAAPGSSSSSSSSDSDDGPGLMQMASEVFGKLVGSDKDQGSSSSPFSFGSLTGLSSLLGGASQASGASSSSSSSSPSSHSAPRLGFFSTLKGVYELFSSGLRRQENGDNLECQQRLMCEIHQRALGSKLFRRSLTQFDKASIESQLQQQLSKLYALATSQQPMTPQRQQQLSLLQARVDQETKNYLNDFYRTLSRQSNQSGETLDCGTLFPRCSRNIVLSAATGLGLGSFDSSSVGSRSMNKLTSLMKKMKFKSSQQMKQQKQSGGQDPLKGAMMQPQSFPGSPQENAKLMQQMMLAQEYQQQQQQQQQQQALQQTMQPSHQLQSSMNTYNDGQYYSQYFANSKSQMPIGQQAATVMNYPQYPQTTMTPMLQGYSQPGVGQQASEMMYQQPNGANMQARQAQYQPEVVYSNNNNPSVPQQNIQQQQQQVSQQQQAQPQTPQQQQQQQPQQQQNVQLVGLKQQQTDSSQMMSTKASPMAR